MEPEAHQRAKRTAAARRTSVSGLIESLLQSSEAETPSVVERMIGAAALWAPGDAHDPRMGALRDKYMKR